MKEIFKQTSNLTALDRFNMKVSKSLQNVAGSTLCVQKAAIGTDVDKDGEEIQTAVLVTDDGVFGSISATVIEQTEELIDILEEQSPIEVAVESRKAQSGRDYLVLVI